jgi:hypothetical protein
LDDLYNILALCNFCILANVLDRRSYTFPENSPHDDDAHHRLRIQYDFNALTPSERLRLSFFRGIALNLISWLSCHYAAVDQKKGHDDAAVSIEDLASDYLRCQACGILNYKARAAQRQKSLHVSSTADIRNQLHMLFRKGLLGLEATMFGEMSVGASFDFGSTPDHYLIVPHDSGESEGTLLLVISPAKLIL